MIIQLRIPCFCFIALLCSACENETEDRSFAESNLEVMEETEVEHTITDDWNNGSFTEQLFTYEARFSDNQYRGSLEASEPFTFHEGADDAAVLITAPHTVYHERDGDPKAAEVYTGSLALLLQEYTGAHVLTATAFTADPAHYEEVPFKEELRAVAENYSISLIIDLHGAGRDHPFSVDIGTGEGENIDAQAAAYLQEYFSKHHIEQVEKDHTFNAVKPETIAAFSRRELHIPSLQVEIHRSLRDPRNDPESFMRLTAALSDYIYALESSRQES